MSDVYFVNTGVFLPKSKIFFDHREEALKYMKKVIDIGLDNDVTLDDIKVSIKLLKIDTVKCPRYKEFYLQRLY